MSRVTSKGSDSTHLVSSRLAEPTSTSIRSPSGSLTLLQQEEPIGDQAGGGFVACGQEEEQIVEDFFLFEAFAFEVGLDHRTDDVVSGSAARFLDRMWPEACLNRSRSSRLTPTMSAMIMAGSG